MPEYSEEVFEQYKKQVQQERLFFEQKARIKGNINSELFFFSTLAKYKEYPLSPDDVFKH